MTLFIFFISIRDLWSGHKYFQDTSLTSHNFSTCETYVLRSLERIKEKQSFFCLAEDFWGPSLDKQRAARSPFQSFVFPSNIETRAGGRVGARRCRRFLFVPEGRAGFFAGFRPANKRSFAPRELWCHWHFSDVPASTVESLSRHPSSGADHIRRWTWCKIRRKIYSRLSSRGTRLKTNTNAEIPNTVERWNVNELRFTLEILFR